MSVISVVKFIIIKILKVLKWIFIILIIGLIILFITIYISSLNSYKKSDFNIPKDFFNTKYYDKDPLSKDNGFKNLVIFNEGLVKEKEAKDNGDYLSINGNEYRISENNYLDKDINLLYFSTLSKCIFKDKAIYTKEYCKTELNRILRFDLENNYSKSFQKLEDFVLLNSKKLQWINNKKFIVPNKEYSGFYSRTIIWTNLIRYTNGVRYVAYKYFEEGRYEEGIRILLDYQKFIDFLTNKSDGTIIYSLVLITINNINLKAIDYFIGNYDLDYPLIQSIYNSLYGANNIYIIKNGLKWEYVLSNERLNYALSLEFLKNNLDIFINYIKQKLFYSKKETTLLNDVYFYEILSNKGKKIDDIPLNINNYIGRQIINLSNRSYKSQFEKEEEMHKLRSDILEKLKNIIDKEKLGGEINIDKKVSSKKLDNTKKSDNKDL